MVGGVATGLTFGAGGVVAGTVGVAVGTVGVGVGMFDYNGSVVKTKI